MSVLVDACVWSFLLRRAVPRGPDVVELERLLQRDEALLLGAVRQELLSGLRHPAQFERLRGILAAFPDYPVRARHYERAAQMCNVCQTHGVQGAATDFLLCAVAELDRLPIFTTDGDFRLFAAHLPIRLHAAP